MRLPKTDDELIEEIFRASRRGPAAAADFCQEVLDSGTWPQGTTRVSLLLQVGEYAEMAGDLDRAERAFRLAVAEPAEDDRSGPDPRCDLVRFCLLHGDPDEGRRLLDDLWRSRPRGAATYVEVGELLEELDDGSGAIKWLTAGALRSLRDDDQSLRDLQFILSARRRVRLAQGFDEDDYDVMALELRDRLYPEFADDFPA